ncbi:MULTISPECIES: hypothetical protein [unclassified Streptomyces]|uniref:hypothetical protein n=1 Tax=unclassified Streptomyces TaxID=2593676 RepID=UPI0003AAB110|nr:MULTISPECIES: hypothetical protein [unclassified Streptomyces]MYQ75479.1 hypothetical protein [Streptomyces sp. SID4923]
MSKNEAVTPSGIPVFTGNLALLDTSVTTLTKSAASTATAAGDVHSSFGGLQAFYKAPEADQLFATTKPVADRGTSLKSELETITAALSTYASDAYPLVEKLKELKREAEAFVVQIKDDDKWREDGDLVEENNRRHDEIAETWAAFQAVERTCHDKIVALVGGPALKIDDGSGKKGTYGYDAETLKHAEGLPWGDPVQESKPWWQLHEHAWDFVKGFFVDGVWGTIKGLGTLVGTDGWDSAKQAWSGLGKLATGLAISGTPLAGLYWTLPDDKLPAYLRESRTAMKETGKALLAWDQWSENPSRATGAVAFNVVTTIFTGGTGGAASGAGKAAVAAKALSTVGKVGRVVDPMTYVFKGAGMGLTKIGDGLTALKGLGQLDIPALPEGTITLPDGAFKLPDGTLHLPEGAVVPEAAFEVPANSFKLPAGAEIPPGALDLGDGVVHLPEGVHPPEGALRIPEGSLKLPDGTTALPENVLKGTDEAGNTVYLDRPGNVLSEDGTLLQHNSAARQEGAGVRASATPEEALVGAGRSSDPATHHAGGGGGHTGDSGVPGPTRHPSGPGSGSSLPSGHGGGGPGSGSGSGGPSGPTHPRVPRPAFMSDGPNPYGKQGSLTREQIEEIQVYRANEESGYREHYYRKDGTRRDTDVLDASGYAPPQLTQLVDNGPWVRAKDAPAPPKPRFLDPDYIRVRADTVTSRVRLRILDVAAQKRFAAIQLDNLMEKWKAEAGSLHKTHDDFESGQLLKETTDAYKQTHTDMGDAAEEFGEAAAEHHFIAERYPDFERQELRGPKNGNDQFDQVWIHEDGRVVVIEAKSSIGTELGQRKLPDGSKVSQGSKEYFDDIVKKMKDRKESDTVRSIRKALRSGKLEYVVVKGEKNMGQYTGYRYRRFDISKGTLP